MVRMQTFFTALADRTRRRILNLLGEQEICVCFLSEVLDINQPKISRHLAYLRKSAIVSARREGKLVFYRITEPEDLYAAQILNKTLQWLKSQEQMQKDYERLMIIYRSSNEFAKFSRAVAAEVLPQANVLYLVKSEIADYLL